MKFVFVRHGETDENKVHIRMGQRVDSSLNAIGVKQVQGLLSKLAHERFDFIFTSPLKRASQTAEIIGEYFGISVEKRNELKERDYGSLSGKTREEVNRITGNEIELRSTDKKQQYDYRPFGGESVAQVKERLLFFIEEVKTKYPNKTILVVSHGGILRLLHHLFENQELSKIDNASIHEFEF